MLSSRTKELLNNTALFGISSFASKLLVFLMVPLYTSVLTPEEYGISDLISTTVHLLIPLLTLCISDAVLRFTIEKSKDSSEVITLGFKIVIYGLFAILAIAPLVGYIFDLGVYAIFLPLLFLVESVSLLLSRFAQGLGYVKYSAIAGVIQTFSIIVFNLIFLLIFKVGIWGYLFSFFLGGLMKFMFLALKLRVVRYIKKDVSLKENVDLVKYSIPLIPNSLSWWLINSASRFIIQIGLGTCAVGLFSAASKLPTIVNVVSGFFVNAWLLSVLKEFDTPDGKVYFTNTYKLFVFVTTAFSIVLMFFTQPLSSFLLNGDFYQGWIYTPILICTSYWGGLSGFLGTVFSAKKKSDLYFKTTIWGGVFSTVLSLIFVKRYGIYAVAISCAVGNFITFIWRLLAVKKYGCSDLSVVNGFINLLFLIIFSFLVIKQLYVYEFLLFLIYLIYNKNIMMVFLRKVRIK